MTDRERFHAIMNYGAFDRGAYMMPWFGFPETFEVWKKQGYRQGDLGKFGTDAWQWHGAWFFPAPPFEREVVDEDETHVLYVNHEGILIREMKNNPMGSMPQFVRFPVETREDFRKFAKERLQPDLALRLGAGYAEQLKALRSREDETMWVISDRWGGFFGPLRNLLGLEELVVRFHTEPAFIEEMMDTIADFVIAQLGQILDVIDIDVFTLWEDMAFNTGPLLSPDMAREYMLPRYKRVVEFAKGRGVPWVALDSDGDVELLLPIWMEAGIDIIYPFEAAAGMDVVDIRKRFGKDLRMYMGIDKRALRDGPKAIDAALDHVRPLIEEGGFIANVDHSIPPDVSWPNFQYYMERLAKVVGKA
jgi:uroporphyrinogen decarboxylase